MANGGTVGTSNGITLNYTDSSGTHTGTVTLDAGDAGVSKNVAQGLQIAFAAGSLSTGDTFTVKAFDPNVQQATDASVSVGTGSGSLVASPTNQVNGVIQGVTLNLLAAKPGENVSLTVAADTGSVATAVQSFVKSYNAVVGTINSATSYDPTTKTAGILLGNSDVGSIQNQLRQAVAPPWPACRS